MSMITHYRFNDTANINTARQFETVEQIKEFLRGRFLGGCVFGADILVRTGQYREMGINYDFRPFLTHYLIQGQYGDLRSGWAPSKGALRKTANLSRKDEIFHFPTA